MTGSVRRDWSGSVVAPMLVGAALLLLWHLGVVYTGTNVFPTPVDVVTAMGELQEQGKLVPYILDSLGRVAAGYVLAVLLGAPLGLFMGSHRDLAAAVNPVVQLLRPISPLAWLPVAVVLLGVGNAPAILLIFLASFFPIVVSSMNAVMSVREVHLRVGRNFGLSPSQVMMRVLLPAAIPQLIIGFRLTLGIAWLVVVAAEMLAVDSGLGYLVIDSRNAGKRYDLVVAAMVCIGLIGLLLDLAMRHLERATVGRWSKAS
jgi:NitT/TauT family transport system permease protein